MHNTFVWGFPDLVCLLFPRRANVKRIVSPVTVRGHRLDKKFVNLVPHDDTIIVTRVRFELTPFRTGFMFLIPAP